MCIDRSLKNHRGVAKPVVGKVALVIALSFSSVKGFATADYPVSFAGVAERVAASKSDQAAVDSSTALANARADGCSYSDSSAAPLVARYKVTSFAIASRLSAMQRPNLVSVARGESQETEPLIELHQMEAVNQLLTETVDSRNRSSAFTLWREGGKQKRVAHEHPKSSITEVWNRPGHNMLRRSRHFDAHYRAVEFESFRPGPASQPARLPAPENTLSGDLAGTLSDSSWVQKYHLVFQLPTAQAPTLHPDSVSQLLEVIADPGTDRLLHKRILQQASCVSLNVLHDIRSRFISEVVWDTEYQLPIFIQSVRDTSTPIDFSKPEGVRESEGASLIVSRWALQSIETDKSVVRHQFERWDSYQTTDFADIGDNESDPFLMRMINLGFLSHDASGFYDMSGNMISSGVGHYHPPVQR